MRRTNLAGTKTTFPVSCGACGRQGHRNDPANPCPLPPAPHAKVGVEIEGFWDGYDRYRSALRLAEEITGSSGDSDGSLRSDEAECDCGDDDCDSHDGHSENHGWHAWELRTKPGSLTEAQSQVQRLYPDGTNDSAGMHVHVSFRCPTDMGLLKSRAFFQYWHERWTAWGTRMKINRSSNFWSRLDGDNRYCHNPLKFTDRYYKDRPEAVFDERYMQLNFHCAYNAHRTVECRLLPMFRDLRLALSGIAELLDIYDSWITGGLWMTDVKEVAFTTSEVPSLEDLTVNADVQWDAPETAFREVVDEHEVSLWRTEPAPGHRMVQQFVFHATAYGHTAYGRTNTVLECLQRDGLVTAAPPPPPPYNSDNEPF